jgi:hypothetical protein
LERHVAEKLDAYTRTYEGGGTTRARGIPKRLPPPSPELAVGYRREAKHARIVSGREEARSLLADWLDPVLARTRGTQGAP